VEGLQVVSWRRSPHCLRLVVLLRRGSLSTQRFSAPLLDLKSRAAAPRPNQKRSLPIETTRRLSAFQDLPTVRQPVAGQTVKEEWPYIDEYAPTDARANERWQRRAAV
jgi:hypothetical protein